MRSQQPDSDSSSRPRPSSVPLEGSLPSVLNITLFIYKTGTKACFSRGSCSSAGPHAERSETPQQ